MFVLQLSTSMSGNCNCQAFFFHLLLLRPLHRSVFEIPHFHWDVASGLFLKCRLDFLEHCFHDGGVLNSILDEGKLVNHSTSPTMGKVDTISSTMVDRSREPLSSFSLRALDVGDELTENYSTYEYPSWLLEISKEYGEDLSYFDLPTHIK